MLKVPEETLVPGDCEIKVIIRDLPCFVKVKPGYFPAVRVFCPETSGVSGGTLAIQSVAKSAKIEYDISGALSGYYTEK